MHAISWLQIAFGAALLRDMAFDHLAGQKPAPATAEPIPESEQHGRPVHTVENRAIRCAAEQACARRNGVILERQPDAAPFKIPDGSSARLCPAQDLVEIP